MAGAWDLAGAGFKVAWWPCTGDVNHNGKVTQKDIDEVMAHIGCRCPDMDVDGNGIVDEDDANAITTSIYYIADFDHDGDVDCTDFSMWNTYKQDFNCDGNVNSLDQSVFWITRADPNGDSSIDCEDADDIYSHKDAGPISSPYDIDMDHDVDVDDFYAWVSVTGMIACP